MHLIRRITPGLIAGSLLLGSVGSALAAQQHPAGVKSHTPGTKLGHAAGMVSGLAKDGSFTLTYMPRVAKNGVAPTSAHTILVTVTATTKETALKGTTGPLQNGEYAIATGTMTATGLTATVVRYSATAPTAGKGKGHHGRHNAARGVVAAGTTPTSLVITMKGNKTLTLTITNTTKFIVNKALATTAPTLAVGQKVAVVYAPDKTTATQLDALTVMVLPTK